MTARLARSHCLVISGRNRPSNVIPRTAISLMLRLLARANVALVAPVPGATSSRAFVLSTAGLPYSAVIDASDGYSELTGGVLEIHFAKNGLRQIDAVNAPAPLRRDFRRSIVEVLTICLQETVINFIQPVVEHLLGIFVPVWRSVSPKQDPVLVFFKKPPCGSRLPSQLSNARGNIHAHVGKPIEVL